MRLLQHLTELAMKKGTKIDYQVDTPKSLSAYINLENGEQFYIQTSMQHYKDRDMDFFLDWLNDVGYSTDEEEIRVWNMVFFDAEGRTMITPKDRGVALELFAGLTEFFKYFVKKKDPQGITFSGGDSKSRSKLYDTISKLIAKKLKYDYAESGQTFMLIKKGLIYKWSR